MPNESAGLVAGFGRLQEGVDGPAVGLRGRSGRIHRLHVDAGVLLHEVDARARSLDLAADGRRHGEPGALVLAEILDGAVDRAILLDQRLHDVVDGLQVQRLVLRPPGRHGQDVVAGFRLRLGGDGQQVLEALRGDVVDLHLDLLLGRPFLNQGFRGLVGAGHPVVPEADRELAGGVGGAHERGGNHRRRCRGRRRHKFAAADPHFLHGVLSCCSPLFSVNTCNRPSRAQSRAARTCALDLVSVGAGSVALDRRAGRYLGYGWRGSMARCAPWRRLQGSYLFLPLVIGVGRCRHLRARLGVVSSSPGIPAAIHRPKF